MSEKNKTPIKTTWNCSNAELISMAIMNEKISSLIKDEMKRRGMKK